MFLNCLVLELQGVVPLETQFTGRYRHRQYEPWVYWSGSRKSYSDAGYSVPYARHHFLAPNGRTLRLRKTYEYEPTRFLHQVRSLPGKKVHIKSVSYRIHQLRFDAGCNIGSSKGKGGFEIFFVDKNREEHLIRNYTRVSVTTHVWPRHLDGGEFLSFVGEDVTDLDLRGRFCTPDVSRFREILSSAPNLRSFGFGYTYSN